MSTDLRKQLASWARAQHEAGVAEDPAGSNGGPPMHLYSLPGETPLSWCGRMVRTGLIFVGLRSAFTPRELYDMAAAAALYRILVEHGAATVKAEECEEGDLRFIMGRGGSDPLTSAEHDGGIHHVGIVSDIDDNGNIHCVDGNWADRVCLNRQPTIDVSAVYLRFPVTQ